MEDMTSPEVIEKIEKHYSLFGFLKEYRVFINGFDGYVKMEVEDLINPYRFGRRVFEEASVLPLLPKGDAYRKWLNQVMQQVVLIKESLPDQE